MADKTTTLKTNTNDNVYPNVIGDNMDNAISDSPQIKHTLTAEHKINFRLDTNVNNLINNSLQKPAGLTKTKLVGVGTNGQENIEIGDNLTLANGKLSAAGVNGLQSDAEGNLTASKNLGVDGKLTLKSLVSASNPDGDITKELGGGGGSTAPTMHRFMITISNDCWFLSFSTKDYGFEIGKEYSKPADFFTNDSYKDLRSIGMHPAGGYYAGNTTNLLISTINILQSSYLVRGYEPSNNASKSLTIHIENKVIYIYRLS